MKVFTTECKDSKTGYSMVLSDCTYNMACDWLERTLKKYGVEICGLHYDADTKMTEFYSGRPADGRLNLCRKYFYDENRGYLLGE